jgi:hypothetical protein
MAFHGWSTARHIQLGCFKENYFRALCPDIATGSRILDAEQWLKPQQVATTEMSQNRRMP